MSSTIHVTFDALDPRSLSVFWRDVLGYIHLAPPGVDLPPDGDPLATWDEFLERSGVPEDRWNSASVLEDPEGNEFCLD